MTSFLLLRHPRILTKLRAEIASTCTPNTILTRDILKRMPYLQNILKESPSPTSPSPSSTNRHAALRLYPSVPVNTRTATRTTVLPTGGGPDRASSVLIPKGSAVAFCVYAMHRRPDLFGMDAEVFRPERWDEGMPLQENTVNAKWGYLPFHGGPRVCLGSKSFQSFFDVEVRTDMWFLSGFCVDGGWVYGCEIVSEI